MLEIMTNNFGNWNFMQPMKRLNMHLMSLVFFFGILSGEGV
jgi:hypothetical protein